MNEGSDFGHSKCIYVVLEFVGVVKPAAWGDTPLHAAALFDQPAALALLLDR